MKTKQIEFSMNQWEALYAEVELAEVIKNLDKEWIDFPFKRKTIEVTRNALMKIYEALVKENKQ